MNPNQIGELAGSIVGLIVVSLIITGVIAVIRVLVKKPMTRSQAVITLVVSAAFCLACRVIIAFN